MQLGQMLWLLAEEGGGGGAVGGFMAFMPFLVIIFLFYFIILRPHRRNEQRRQEMIRAIQKNDKVVTMGGIVGTVANISDRFVTLKMDDGAKIKMLRTSISGLLDERVFDERKDSLSESDDERADDEDRD